ncbi:unnamed protein product [Ixodes pacificus]
MISGDIAKDWRLFKQKLELFLTASVPGLEAHTSTHEDRSTAKRNWGRHLGGVQQFRLQCEEDNQDYATVVGKFDEFFAAQLNEVHERYLLRRSGQGKGEPAEQFIRELRQISQSYNFNTMRDSMVRDQIVFGTNNDKVREK